MSQTEQSDSEARIPPPPLQQLPCRKCGRPIASSDAYCRHCGAQQCVTDPIYYRPATILALAFFVLGPFALGLVWRAKAIGRNTKLALAAIILAYSIFTLYAAYILIAAVYRELSVLNSIL